MFQTNPDRRESSLPPEVLMQEIFMLRQRVKSLETEVTCLHRDALTGAEKFHLKESQNEILKLLERAEETNTPVTVMMADMDNFKAAQAGNHLWGDNALAMAAAGLIDCLRPTDLLFHHGGDQFVIVAPGLDTAAINGVRERLEHCLDNIVIRGAGREGAIGMTIGITSKQTNFDLESMILEADTDLQKRKNEKKVGR